MKNWYYENQGAQQGPVPLESLRSFIAQGTLPGTARVWTEGMPDWVPANQVPALSSSMSGPAAAGNPYAVSTAGLAGNLAYQPQGGGGIQQFPFVKRTNYALMLGLILGGGAVLIAGVIALATEKSDLVLGGGIGTAVGLGVSCWGWILSFIYLYRAWLVLQPYTSASTPGKAVGFLFIPLFNFYWQFIAYWKWSQEWNRLVGYQRPGAPRMGEGLFLTYAILQVSALLLGALASLPGGIIYLIIMRQICNAVDYAADNQG